MKKKIGLIEPKPNTSKVVTDKKPLKSEIIEQLKALQMENDTLKYENDTLKQENDTLKHENAQHASVIKSLEEKVLLPQKTSLDVSSKGAQTSSSEIKISCNVCIYVATCEEELNWHMGHDHDQSDDSFFDRDFYCDICSKWFDKESDMIEHKEDHRKIHSDRLHCNFCDKKFSTKKDLMKHKKKIHTEKVSTCWRFAQGTCIFGDQNCWFSHPQSSNNLEAEKFKCSLCEKDFWSLSDCLRHRKQDHKELVPLCRNETNGTCKFGNTNCWFTHKKQEK